MSDLFTPEQVVILLDVERARRAEADQRAWHDQQEKQRLVNLCAAFRMLGLDLGFTEADARARWKKAGYGGL